MFRWTLQAEELRSPADGTLAFTLWAPWMSVKKSSLHPGPVTDWCWHSHHGEEHQESGSRLLLWRAKDQKTNVDVYQEGQSFLFSLKEFFPLKQTKFTRMCLIWFVLCFHNQAKIQDNNNRKQCGRRRWRWQEVASYLRLQPILWQILSVRATNRRPSCVKINDLHPLPPHRLRGVRWAIITIGSLSWWLE